MELDGDYKLVKVPSQSLDAQIQLLQIEDAQYEKNLKVAAELDQAQSALSTAQNIELLQARAAEGRLTDEKQGEIQGQLLNTQIEGQKAVANIQTESAENIAQTQRGSAFDVAGLQAGAQTKVAETQAGAQLGVAGIQSGAARFAATAGKEGQIGAAKATASGQIGAAAETHNQKYSCYND